MDTLTHALLGAAISDAGFRRRLGPIATPFSLAVAALPDIDAVTYLIAPEYAWAHHRGYSHSFAILVLAAPLLGYAGWRLGKKSGSWLLWSLLALACLFSHTLLDLATSWGTMPWLPFSNARVSWDLAPILDLFVTSITAASFLLNRLLRRERVDTFKNPLAFPVVHRHPGRQKAANRIGTVAVALIAVYLLLGWQQNRQTVRIARQELAAAGVEAAEVRALPLLFTYISWGIVARDAEGAVYNAVYSSYAPRPMRFARHPSASGPAVARALGSPEGRLFSWYSQGMYVAGESPAAAGARVELSDRRFFTLTNSYQARFFMDFSEDAAGRVTGVESRQLGFRGVDFREELRRLWNLTRYGDTGGELAAAK